MFLLFSLSVSSHLLCRRYNRTRPQEFWLFRTGQQDQATGVLVVPDWPTEAGHRSPGCPGLANRPGHRNPGCSGLANRSRPQESWLSRTGEQTSLQESWLFRIVPGCSGCFGLANRTRPQEPWLFRISQQKQATGVLVVQDWRTDQATGILVVPDWPTEAGHRNPGCPGLANRTRPQESWLSRIGEQDQTTGILVVPDWTT